MSKHLVFVYGTLLSHQPNHRYLRRATCLAHQAWTTGKMVDVGTYPALIPHPFYRVYGELYAIKNYQLERLDILEAYYGKGAENHYERIRQTVFTDKGSQEAWIYVYPKYREWKYPHFGWGDWRVYRELTKPEILYFAYGSCMDKKRMEEQGVAHLFTDIVGRGVLPGYSLHYTHCSGDGGRADLLEIGGYAEGKVYRIGQEALLYLYDREGAREGGGTYRPAFVDVRCNGKIRTMLTFLVTEKDEETAPPAHYFEEIYRGALGILRKKYIEKLVRQYRELIKIKIGEG